MRAPRFHIAACPPAEVKLLTRELGVSGALAQVLVRRGLGEPARARAFLTADEEHPPDAFTGIDEAVRSIVGHVRDGARITVHGDYDVDGVCSTAVLVRALRRLGADVDWYLPDRTQDGYGLKAHTVQRLAARGTRLLLTADCAITAVEEVAAARALGMDVVITDHHAPREDGKLPRAPIVHPAVCGYPCPELCATAVAFKLAQALSMAGGAGGAPGGGRDLEHDLDLVALATIADVVPLVGENRTLARRGLAALAGTAKPGLRALMAVARVEPAKVNERAVGFALAPRLNAAGRLYRADAALELILTEDRARAARLASELDRANHERRQAETHIRLEAEAQIAALASPSADGHPSAADGRVTAVDGRSAGVAAPALAEEPFAASIAPHGHAAYVLAGEGWHRGVIGIVAARLVECHHRPVVLIALEGDAGHGSGRSIEAFDLLDGLSACGGHLRGYGGHRAAAGLEIERGRVHDFAAALCAHAERVLAVEDLAPRERVDAVVGGQELGMRLAEELQTLAPFGRGNPSVSLLLADAVFRDARAMGEGRHVRFTVESRGARARAVAFGGGGRLPVPEGEPAEATFTLEVNEWRGVSEPRLVLRHARPRAEEVLAREIRPRTRETVAEHVGGRERTETPRTPETAEEREIVGARAGARASPSVPDEELVLFASP
jgi:single-stranded-DNA-specific exonuclease